MTRDKFHFEARKNSHFLSAMASNTHAAPRQYSTVGKRRQGKSYRIATPCLVEIKVCSVAVVYIDIVDLCIFAYFLCSSVEFRDHVCVLVCNIGTVLREWLCLDAGEWDVLTTL